MKLLVIGIDGGTKSILEGMPMPFTQSLFKGAASKHLEEDLISRGWAEALTGEHASTNKGFYLMPCADGSYDYSCSYFKTDMLSDNCIKAITKLQHYNGVSDGIFKVPTSGRADDFKGFMIDGDGGRETYTGGKPDEMLSPTNYK